VPHSIAAAPPPPIYDSCFHHGACDGHRRPLQSIREYYVDITHNNLEKIKELKGLVAERRRAEEADLLAIRKLARENHRMALPLKQANEDVYRLKEQLSAHEADKDGLRVVTAALLVVEQDAKATGWEQEILEQRLARAEREVAELQAKYLEVTSSVDQKNGFERLLLEKRIQATKAEIDTREAQMHHVLVDVGKVQSQAVRQITDRPNPIAGKVEELRALRAHFETLDATYVAMVGAVTAKLEEFGVAPNEVGFEPRASLRDLDRTAAGQAEGRTMGGSRNEHGGSVGLPQPPLSSMGLQTVGFS